MFAVVHEETGQPFYGGRDKPAIFEKYEEADTIASFFSPVYGPLIVKEN